MIYHIYQPLPGIWFPGLIGTIFSKFEGIHCHDLVAKNILVMGTHLKYIREKESTEDKDTETLSLGGWVKENPKLYNKIEAPSATKKQL